MTMSKRLGRNYEDPDSQRWWAAAEKAAASRRKLVIPASPDEKTDDVPTVQYKEPDSSDEDKDKA
jgi:hypothetical protein